MSSNKENKLIDELKKEIQSLKNENFELKNKQIEIDKAKELYLGILEDFPALIWRANTEKLCDYFNTTWLEFTGRTMEQEYGFGWAEGVHSDDLDRCVEIYTTKFDQREPFSMEYRLKNANQEYRWILDYGRPYFDLDKTFLGYIGSCYDITENKINIQQLKSHHSMLEKLTQNVPGCIYQYRLYPDGHSSFPYASGGIKEIYEVEPKDVIEDAQPVFDILYPDDLEMIVSSIQDSADSMNDWNVQYRVNLPKKGVRWLEGYAKPEKLEDGSTLWHGYIHDITERKTIEKALEESEKRFKSLMEQSPSVVEIYDLDGLQIEVNHAYELMWGFPASRTINKFNLFKSEEIKAKGLLDSIKKVYAGETVRFPIFQFDPTGKTEADGLGRSRWLTTIMYPLKDNDNNVINIVMAHEDVTERIEVEHQIENLFAVSNIGLAITSLEKGWIRVNQTLLDTLGYEEDEFKKTQWPDITHPDDIQRDIALFNEVLEGKRDGYKIEKRFIKKDGSIIDAIITVAAFKADDKIEYFLASVLETTELKQAQRDFQTIIQEAPNPIMVHNEDGKVLLLNKVWEELTGYSYSEINTTEKWTKKAYGKEMPTIKKYIDGLYELNHAVNEGEYPIIRNDGEVITWQFSSAPLGVMDGKRTVISSAMDITELKKKDEMMINQSRQAAMGDMIAMIAHQWRQPITVIGMEANNINMNILLEEEITTEELKKMAESITQQTQQLSQTIDDFRNFFQPNQEKVQTTVGSVLKSTLKIVGKSMENNNISLIIENRSETEILTYPNELLQVLLNLLGNAKDILLEQEVSDAKITITIDETKDSIVTKICDNGGGIPENAIKRLGEPYFTTKEEGSGTGLGLYMSITIVEKHLNGSLTWENNNKGACFIVTLPTE